MILNSMEICKTRVEDESSFFETWLLWGIIEFIILVASWSTYRKEYKNTIAVFVPLQDKNWSKQESFKVHAADTFF